MPKKKLVLDTNIWLDWLVFQDTGIAHIRQLQEAGHVEICIDEVCEAELAEVLARDFGRRMQLAELEYIAGSRAAQTALAENYVGLPL